MKVIMAMPKLPFIRGASKFIFSRPQRWYLSLADALSGIDTLNLIALSAVVPIGLPHGAMDGALAAHFGWMESKEEGCILPYWVMSLWLH